MTSPHSCPALLIPEPGPIYSVIVPVYNSEATLPDLYRRLVTTMERLGQPFELVFAEDGGRDGSWAVLQELALRDHRVKALQLMRNSGQGNATLAGMQVANGSFFITLDDDLQHPPEELPTLIQALRQDDELDVVIGAPAVKQHSLVRKLGSSVINQLNSWFLHKDPSLRFTGFRVMRRMIADQLIMQSAPYPALGPMLISITPRISNIVVRHEARASGESGYNFRRLVKQTLANLIGFSVLPLHLLAILGAIGIALSLLGGAYFTLRYFTHGIGVPGWTTLLMTLLALSGFNFFAFGILGEYILRISQTTERRNGRAIRRIVQATAKNAAG